MQPTQRALRLGAGREQGAQFGCGSTGLLSDTQQAVVLATLAALNRVVGGLRTREPTEYVLRPASTEESGANTRID